MAMSNPNPRYPYKLATKIHIDSGSFFGGMAVDSKMGPRASFSFSQALDFRKQPSQMTVLPSLQNLSVTMPDLPLGMEMGPDGTKYMIGNAGYLTSLNSSNTLATIGNIGEVGGSGIVYNQNTDSLYISGQKTVARYGLLQGTSTLLAGNFAQSVSADAGVTNIYSSSAGSFTGVARSTAAATYTVPTSIIDTSVNQGIFQPDIEPFYSIKVFIVSKGTGNWTLTLHDPLNAVLGTVTVANASLTNNALNEFVFTTPVRAQIKPAAITYHLHLTSTVADGTASVVVANDLSTGYYTLYANRLVQQNNGLHPMTIFTTFLCIGNSNYLSTYDFTLDNAPPNTSWIRNRLVFPPGYETTCLSVNDQYLVIGMGRKSTSTTQRGTQDGYLFFWDGVAGSPNFFIPITMGVPESAFTMNNITYFYVNGSLYAWAGAKTVTKVRTIPNTDTEYTGFTGITQALPNMMTSRNNVLMAGYPSQTVNTNVKMGIYSWGSIEMAYPNSFGFSYITSSGLVNYSGANNYKIGLVANFGDTLYTGYSYTSGGTVYALDAATNSSPPASIFTWESLNYDGGVVYKQKQALRMRITFGAALPTGITITPKYKIDGGSWQFLTVAAVGATSIVSDILNGRFYELQWGFDGVNVGGTATPIITDIVMEVDALGMEIAVI